MGKKTVLSTLTPLPPFSHQTPLDPLKPYAHISPSGSSQEALVTGGGQGRKRGQEECSEVEKWKIERKEGLMEEVG